MLTPETITPETLNAATPEERTEAFETCAALWYGTTRFGPRITADFAVSRSALFAWKRNNATPHAVILALAAWLETREIKQLLLSFQRIVGNQN